MKRSPLIGCLLFISLFGIIFSCNKFDLDDILHHPDKVPQLCDIKKITSFRSPYTDTLVANFVYDHWGNPTSILLSTVTTGQTQFHFRYDSKKRLKDFIAAYDNYPPPGLGYEGWHRYVWENDRIIRDTFWGLGDSPDGVNPGTEYPGNHLVNTYEYDAYGRIAKVNSHTLLPFPIPPTSETYHYNLKGNLTHIRHYTNGVLDHETVVGTYDDKVSLLRTNKIWMFIQRNYSVNNNIAATSFNKYGLPLKFDAAASQSLRFLFNNYDIAEADIKYDCK